MSHQSPSFSLIGHEIYHQDYRSPQRQEWYGSVATAYRWARPRYPASMLDRVFQQANLRLSPATSLLEVGCGPGIATTALAERGVSITAIEPSQGACKVARDHCQSYPNVSILNSTFEDFALTEKAAVQGYDAVLAATSFHWLSPAIACSKSANALKPDGALILLWATPPQPPAKVYQLLQPIYEKHGLSSLGEEQSRTLQYYLANFEYFAEKINQSGYFKPSQVEFEACESMYSIEKYVALLSTLSGYISLPTDQRQRLLEDVRLALQDQLEGSELSTCHWFAAQVAIKQP